MCCILTPTRDLEHLHPTVSINSLRVFFIIKPIYSFLHQLDKVVIRCLITSIIPLLYFFFFSLTGTISERYIFTFSKYPPISLRALTCPYHHSCNWTSYDLGYLNLLHPILTLAISQPYMYLSKSTSKLRNIWQHSFCISGWTLCCFMIINMNWSSFSFERVHLAYSSSNRVYKSFIAIFLQCRIHIMDSHRSNNDWKSAQIY